MSPGDDGGQEFGCGCLVLMCCVVVAYFIVRVLMGYL
jgi:hypothetical protein